jgi:vancomycin permeability regulator SanA
MGALGLSPLLVLAPFAWLVASTGGHRSSAAAAPARPVALVLGAGVRPDGTPSPLLARRLDIAADLYRRGRVDAVLVTGNNAPEANYETDTMRAYLVATGIPERKIVADEAGFTTWDSCTRAYDMFGVRAATVITQTFHLPRAVALCRAAGIDATGVGDASLDARRVATIYGYTREVAAAFKAAAEALFRPAPRVIGSYETGIDDALAAPR